MAKITLNTRDAYTMFDKLAAMPKDLPKEMLQEFVKNTPIRSGNARKNTRLRQDTIVADYAYSQRLEDGYSKQAPRGMIEPTIEWLEDEVNRRIKGIK